MKPLKEALQEVEWRTLETLKYLNEIGVQFSVHPVDGWLHLNPEEVMAYLKNPDLACSEKQGVSLEHWKAYKAFMENPRCYALTKKGKPCKNFPLSYFDMYAQKFDPDISVYCNLHQQRI